MIITCPECSARFVVPSTVFMNGGRKMRCASCKHVWFQEEPLERADDPAASREDTSPRDSLSPPQTLVTLKKDFAEGKILIAIGFCVVIALFMGYRMMFPPLIMGQGLAFDSVSVSREGHNMTVTGQIVNTMDGKRGVPSVKMVERLAHDLIGDSVVFSTGKDVLNAGEAVAFTYTLHDVIDGVQNLTVTFDGKVELDQPVVEHEQESHVPSQPHHNDSAHH